MTHPLFMVLRSPLRFTTLCKVNNIGLASIYAQDIKNLYSKTTLGIDGFKQQRERTQNQMVSIADKFKEKMTEIVMSQSQNMIFTEDLKNMIHLADNDNDIELTVEMLKRYNKQNKSLRFGNYIFGPVVMRMFYIHNKVDLALECFESEELSGIFDQLISFQILLDLLYENEKYNDILDVFKIIEEKQLGGQKYPKNVVVLALAACFKLNNKESLDYALKLWSDLHEIGHQPMRRATTFCAGLALNQGKADITLEILPSARNQSYTTVRNLKVAALAELGRIDYILPILKGVLQEDVPRGQGQIHTFNRDVIDRVKKAIASTDNPEITLEFERLEQILEQQGHIVDKTLNEQLCTEIQRPPVMNSRDFRQQQFESQRQSTYNRRPLAGFRSNKFQGNRPGLAELV